MIVIQEHKNRATGTTIQVIDNRDGSFDTDDLPWITFCDDHGMYCSHDTRKLAMDWSAEPQVWCEGCQDKSTRN